MNEVHKKVEFEKCETVIDKIVWSMQYQPEDWECDDYHLRNTKNDISFWIANGFSYFKLELKTEKIKIPFLPKWKLWRAYNKYLKYRSKKVSEILSLWKY